jgi:hypothetical protein
LLIEKGYLMFIHPPSWRKPEHYLWNVISNKQIIYLKCITEKKSKELFNCGTIVDYYILENVIVYKKCIIEEQDDKIYNVDITKWNFLPSALFDDIEQILGNNSIVYSSSIYDTRRPYISNIKTKTNIYPIVHSMTKKDGLGFVYSSENKGQIGISKVILSFGRHQYPYNDYNGEYGMSQITYGLEIKKKKEGDDIVKAINTDKFKEILKYTKWSTFQTDWRMFKYFRNDFYKYFLEDKIIVENTNKIKQFSKQISNVKIVG